MPYQTVSIFRSLYRVAHDGGIVGYTRLFAAAPSPVALIGQYHADLFDDVDSRPYREYPRDHYCRSAVCTLH